MRQKNVERVQRFRARIENIESICGSILAWIDGKSTTKNNENGNNNNNTGFKKLVIGKSFNCRLTGDNDNSNVDTSFDDTDVTHEELAKIHHLNSLLEIIMEKMFKYFVTSNLLIYFAIKLQQLKY